jgi:hypothetical protein
MKPRILILLLVIITQASCTVSKMTVTRFNQPTSAAMQLKQEVKSIGRMQNENTASPETVKMSRTLPVVDLRKARPVHTFPIIRSDSTDTTATDSAATENPCITGVYKGYDMFAISATVLFLSSMVFSIVGSVIMSVLAMPLGEIVGGVLSAIGGIAYLSSFVAGFIGLRRIRKSKGKLKGKGYARLPFVVLAIEILLGLFVTLLLIALLM